MNRRLISNKKIGLARLLLAATCSSYMLGMGFSAFALDDAKPASMALSTSSYRSDIELTPGYFMVFAFDQGRIQPPEIMTTSKYVPNRIAQHSNNWRIRVLNAENDELFVTSLDDPQSLTQALHSNEQDLRLIARVPQLASAARIELVDTHGAVAWQQNTDASFKKSAGKTADQAISLAHSLSATPSITADNPIPKAMEFAEHQRQTEYAAAITTLNQSNTTHLQRAQAQQTISTLNRPDHSQPSPTSDAKSSSMPTNAASLKASTLTANIGTAFVLSGTINIATASSTPITSATVRAYRSDNGAYIVSTVADPATGHYEMQVPAGTYDVELNLGAREFVEEDKVLYLAPQRISKLAVNAATRQDFSITPSLRTLNLSIKRSNRNIEYSSSSVAIEISQAGKVVARPALNVYLDSSKDNQDGTETAFWQLQISPGIYDITIEATSDGVASKTFSGIDLSKTDQTLAFDTGITQAWKGQLIDNAGHPVANREISSFDGLFHYRGYTQTDANGNFSIAVAPGWLVKFPAPTIGNSLMQRFEVVDTTNLPATVKLDALKFESTVTGNTTRIYTGDAEDGHRFRMFFIGDGYTTAHETFTDKNGNGVWDGVLWYDLNGNGVFDQGTSNSRGDLYATYGNVQGPIDGSVPDKDNEPFVDTNGDHFPNFDDAATFTLNAQQYVRNLLGAHYWSDHRADFQADIAFVPSKQAGITITDKNGYPIYTANTTFGSNLETVRYVLSLDRTKALQVAEQLLPGFDCLIIMINEPILAGRASETIGGNIGVQLESGGVHSVSPNSQVMAHEMGHFVGSLADEYSELYTMPAWSPLQGANVALGLDTNSIPWASSLPAGQALPDLVPRLGIGVFEGADYLYGSYYRPTWTSMMRSPYNGQPFNAPSIAALDIGLQRFTHPALNLNQHGLSGSWYNPTESGQGLGIEIYPDLYGSGHGLIFGGWFTFDSTASGGQRWYSLSGDVSSASTSAALTIGASYAGNFDALPKVPSTPVGTGTLQFSDCTHGVLHYHFNDGSDRNGMIPLTRLLNNGETCSLAGKAPAATSDYLLSGNWYDSDTSGQGLFFDLSPTQNILFGAWYTFAPNGAQLGGGASQRWYTLQTSQFTKGIRTLNNIPIITSTEGIFDKPIPTVTQQVGSANIAFQSCNSMTLTYTFTSGDNQGLNKTMNLQRVGPTPVGCSL